MRKAMYVSMFIMIGAISSCDRHILKKLKADSKEQKQSASSEIDDALSNSIQTNAFGGDLTGHPRKNGKAYLVASLKKTPCLGECSAYEAKLYSDGRATFFGRKNVNLIGRFEAKLPTQQMQELIARIQSIDYFGFENKYPTIDKQSSYSKIITSIQLGEQSQKVINNGSAPRRLMTFESYLDELFDRLDWLEK